MTLGAHEFMRRFLLHELPKGFCRIRHYGFLANACRASKLAAIRTALQVQAPPSIPDFKDYRDRCEFLTGHRPDECPHCRGTMVVMLVLEPARPHQRAWWRRYAAQSCDSS
jgi:hypothetical protein